jgi:PhnB protein
MRLGGVSREGPALPKQFKPDGWRSVTPRLLTPDVEGTVAFLRSVFDARGELNADRPTELLIGDSIVMVSHGGGVREAMPTFLYVYVEDADATYGRATDAGAETIEPPTDTPYGDRRATVKDRWGNTWQIATRQER